LTRRKKKKELHLKDLPLFLLAPVKGDRGVLLATLGGKSGREKAG